MIKAEEVKAIAVIGAGLMGHGIAMEFALGGYAVSLYDRDGKALDASRAKIRKNLDRLIGFGFIDRRDASAAATRVAYHGRLEDAVGQADVVIEAITEDLRTKQELFQRLDSICPEGTLFASNTSTLLPSQLAEVTNRPEKVVVAHYFNPPYLLPLVEVVRHPGTSDETVDCLCAVLSGMGKAPVIVQKECLGFIGNRLQIALFREALNLVDSGIVSAADVDTVMKTSIGRRWAAAGIFEVWDLAGWDIIHAVATNLLPDINSSTAISPRLDKMVAAGDLGEKTGKGFYSYTPASAESLRQRLERTLVELERLSRQRG